MEAQAVEAMTAAFKTAWALLHPGNPSDCPVAVEGEAFDSVDKWVRFSIVMADGAQLSMGGKNERLTADSGFIAVQVFADANQGVLARSALCDDVRAAIQLQDIAVAGSDEAVRIRKGVSRNPSTDGRWMMQVVVLPFEFISVA